MRTQYMVLIIHISISLTALSKPRNLVLIWDKINCTANEKYIHNTTCHIHEPDHRTLSTRTTFLKDISNVKFIFRVFFPNNGVFSSQPFIEFDISVCKFLMGSVRNSFLKLFREALGKYSNFPSKCPFYKGFTYYVQNFTMDTTNFPAFVPETSFIGDATVYIPAKGTLYSALINGRLAGQNKNSRS